MVVTNVLGTNLEVWRIYILPVPISVKGTFKHRAARLTLSIVSRLLSGISTVVKVSMHFIAHESALLLSDVPTLSWIFTRFISDSYLNNTVLFTSRLMSRTNDNRKFVRPVSWMYFSKIVLVWFRFVWGTQVGEIKETYRPMQKEQERKTR